MDQLSFGGDFEEVEVERPVVLVDTIQALESTTVVSSDVSNSCPVCRKCTVQ